MSCQRASKVSANERRYRRGTRRPLCGRTERADTGLRCGDETNKKAKRTKNVLGELKQQNEDLKKKKGIKASDMR